MFTISQNYKELLNDRYFCDVVDGELMGDGCVTCRKSKTGNLSYSFCYTTVNYEYIKYLHDFLCQKTGSKVKISVCIPKPGHVICGKLVKHEKTKYSFSISHYVFSFFYNRWYPEGKKIFPSIDFNPTICKHWYIGDGTIYAVRTPSISLHTEGFTEKDVTNIIENLRNIGFNSRSNNNIVRFHGKTVLNFLEYIGKCPVSSYLYKWDLKNYKKITKRCSCGNIFTTYAHEGHEQRQNCSNKCKTLKKQKNAREKLNNFLSRKIIDSAVSVDGINEDDKAYLLGHILSTGKQKSNDIISIDILDAQLKEKMSKLINFNPVPNYKDKIFIKNPRLTVEQFWNDNMKNHVLRGIFDAAGVAVKCEDNYFMIILRNKSPEIIKKIHDDIKIGKIQNNGKEIKISRKERSLFYKLVYTNSENKNRIQSEKKHKTVLSSCLRKREINQNRDIIGRFLTK